MRIIKPSAEVLLHNVSPYQFIEKVGRTCYKSEDKITEGSAEKFVKNLIDRKHFAMLEHEHIYLVCSSTFLDRLMRDTKFANISLRYFNITLNDDTMPSVISGSFRAFLDLLKLAKGIDRGRFLFSGDICPLVTLAWLLEETFPLMFEGITENLPQCRKPITFVEVMDREKFVSFFRSYPSILFRHLIHTVKFVCDRGVSHELVRHRPCSFAQESTRYCNYNKEKFGNEITVIQPFFFEEGTKNYNDWVWACQKTEDVYMSMLENGATPQEARSVLPNSLKTEIILTATEEEWYHIVKLRFLGTTGAPHPQMKEVMTLVVTDLGVESEGRIHYEAN